MPEKLIKVKSKPEQKEPKNALSFSYFIFEAALFSITFLLGLLAAFKQNQVISKIFQSKNVSLPEISFWKFVFGFGIALLIVLPLFYFVKSKNKKKVIFKSLFAVSVFFGGFVLINSWIPLLPALILAFILTFWWLLKPSILNQNICIGMGIAGAGAVLGIAIKPTTVVFLLVCFSIYDFIAVYKTKHMVKMAKEMIESEAVLGIIVPKTIFELNSPLKEADPRRGKTLVLGAGDIVFPLMLAASLTNKGIACVLVVSIFSLIGLLVGFLIFKSKKIRRPMPALPPIAFFSIIGYLITLAF